MACILNFDKQVSVVSMLCEGASIRGIERITGVHRDTIMRLGSRVGQACAKLHDEKMRGLNCQRVQVDELWGFIRKKEANVLPEEAIKGYGDAYTYVALDADTKLIPAYRVGRRDSVNAQVFMEDLAGRLANKIQLSSDGFTAYINAAELAFGCSLDYGQVIKSYTTAETVEQRRYSPAKVTRVEKSVVAGSPDEGHISTSFVEAQNLGVRMHVRRLSRLTNAYSKKLENLRSAVALHFAYYNFVKFHSTVRMTPAMAAGVESSPWKVADLVEYAR